MGLRAAYYTLGCKVNQYESEAVANLMVSYGYETVDFSEYADVYVINTCTVTGLADRKCRQIMRRAKGINKEAVVVVMGCYSQVSPDEVAKIKEVDIIIGTNERKSLPQIIEAYCNKYQMSKEPIVRVGSIKDVHEFEELGIDTYNDHTRAFLKIQDGCDRYCSYCIIPYARGAVRSREPNNILCDIKELVSKGYKEFVLTGIHLASYGRDLKNIDLVGIIREICKIDGVKRLRLGSIEPMTITQEFVEMVKSQSKICPHFHISLQSGSDSVLERMNRKYTAKEYLRKCNLLKANISGLALTTDIIVGFPGETAEEFEDTVKFVKKIGFSKIHVFKYSPRKDTPAAKMPHQIEPKQKEERSKRLVKISDLAAEVFSAGLKGKEVEVLVEKRLVDNEKKMIYEGHSENFVKVKFERIIDHSKCCNMENYDLCGEIINVFITGSEQENAQGIMRE